MPKVQLAFLLLLAYTISPCSMFGQQFIFNKVLPSDGKTFLHVTGITQDNEGNMWFSTKKGLYFYNGYQMISYKNNPLDPNSLITNQLESICVDSSGYIWLGTSGMGLDQFDPSTGQFRHFSNDPENPESIHADGVYALCVDHEGTLWAATSLGLDRYDARRNAFIHYSHDPADSTSLSSNAVVSIYEDRQGTIWVGTGSVYTNEPEDQGGLNRLDRNTGKFTRFKHNPADPKSLINNKVGAIFEDSKGNFWVGTAGDGLHTMDRQNGTFERHSYDPEHPDRLSRPPLSKTYAKNEHVTFIREDANGGIWIGSSESGINYYDPVTGKVTHFESDKEVEGSYSDMTSWSAYSSRDGTFWIGTIFGNLFRVDPFRQPIHHFPSSNGPVNCFLEDPAGYFRLGTNQGLIQKDHSNEISGQYLVDRQDQASEANIIYAIQQDPLGNTWIGGWGGLNILEKNKDHLSRFKIDPGDQFKLNDNLVFAIFADQDPIFWIATLWGLIKLNTKTAALKVYYINPGDSASFGRNIVTSVTRDHMGNLWAGAQSGGGINLLDEDKGVFKEYLAGTSVNSIYEDSDKIMWVGTNEGLFRYDRTVDAFIIQGDIKSFSGIPEVLSIVEDDLKFLWLGTSDGILRLNPQRNEWNVYGRYFGITENSLIARSIFKGNDNELYFGDTAGYFKFDPQELNQVNKPPPEIFITGFRLADLNFKTGSGGSLSREFSHNGEIRLAYYQNVFSFDFAAIDYSEPEENRHFFMLENYDASWHQANMDRRAYYFNIPPGKYIFRVKASNVYGIWSEKQINIILLPPWWKKWWAYMIYGFLFLLLIFIIDRIQRRRVIAKERSLAKEKELAQAREIEKAYSELKSTQAQLIQSEKMASLGELTAGIAHEIQNPLNFVNNFSEVSSELVDEMKEELAVGRWQLAEGIADDLKQNLEKILLHGKRADAIVKGMLQHSRTSSGQKEPTDINALAYEYLRLAYHGLRAKDKSFNADFKTDFESTLPKINVIPQDIGRVLLNLINNAFYAVSSRKLSGLPNLTGLEYKPTVIVSTRKLNNSVEIRVQDNGIGIPADLLEKIFQPFFTTKPTGQGTGLGLSLSYDIIKAHGGELKVETKEGEGTEFIIHLPDHLQKTI